MAPASVRVLLFTLSLYSASSTRFLPSIIWDNVNPLLNCPYNWLVVPRVDLHDIVEFVCPTSKLVVKQVNYYTRIGDSMNFNLLRREWAGSVEELQQSIRNGSIHSFCNVSHPDSVKLYTCRDGTYNSFPVKFTHLLFDSSTAKYEKYEKHKTYVFYSNAVDGQVSSLDTKQARCSMLFAVYIVSQNKIQFDITYGKKVVPNCDPSSKPTLVPAPTTRESTTISTTSSTPTPTTSPSSTTIQEARSTPPSTTTIKSDSTEATTSEETRRNALGNIATIKTTRPTDSDPDKKRECEDNWLSLAIFIAIVVATFITGVLCSVLFYTFLWRRPARKDGYNNAYYSRRELQTATPDGTLSTRSSVV